MICSSYNGAPVVYPGNTIGKPVSKEIYRQIETAKKSDRGRNIIWREKDKGTVTERETERERDIKKVIKENF